jgi:hypothetical protein
MKSVIIIMIWNKLDKYLVRYTHGENIINNVIQINFSYKQML